MEKHHNLKKLNHTSHLSFQTTKTCLSGNLWIMVHSHVSENLAYLVVRRGACLYSSTRTSGWFRQCSSIHTYFTYDLVPMIEAVPPGCLVVRHDAFLYSSPQISGSYRRYNSIYIKSTAPTVAPVWFSSPNTELQARRAPGSYGLIPRAYGLALKEGRGWIRAKTKFLNPAASVPVLPPGCVFLGSL